MANLEYPRNREEAYLYGFADSGAFVPEPVTRKEAYLDRILEKFRAIEGAVVTPEMYGAKGDGIADDTYAVLTAISENETVFLPHKYKITDTITIESQKTVVCYGEINYTGTGSAFVISYSYVNLYINRLITTGNGIEMKPRAGEVLTHCQMDIVECNEIYCIGSGKIGIYLNCDDGIIQFCRFRINRLSGGDSIGTNTGIKFYTKTVYTQYCNGNEFDIGSICFFNKAILGDCVANSCISNTFSNLRFEQNNYSIEMANTRFYMSACFDEPTSGKIKVTDGTTCIIQVQTMLSESLFDIDVGHTYTSYFEFIGRILNSNGAQISTNLFITSQGIFAYGTVTPSTCTVLTTLISDLQVRYILNGGSLDLPAVRYGGIDNTILQKIIIHYHEANGVTGSFTFNFSDNTSQTVSFSKSVGVFIITPNKNNNGEWVAAL